jgi:xanthine dehydrogenase small subunit
MIRFYLNNEPVSTGLHPATTVLDYLRLEKHLTGTKEGCREGDCGACTVLVGTLDGDSVVYKSMNSCLLPIGDIYGKHIVSVEGLNLEKGLNLVQQNMADEGGTQCGFCTPGFIMSLTGYFLNNPAPDIDSAIAALDGNICRCTGYAGIKRSINGVLEACKVFSENSGIERLTELNIVPQYFTQIAGQLKNIEPQEEIPSGNVHIGGGTDLFVQRWESLYESDVEFLSGNVALKGITKTNNAIIIGGGTTHSEVAGSEEICKLFPQIREGLKLFGSLPIRNRGTIAGNICNASPIADMVNMLLALGASITLIKGDEKRELPLKDFYKGYKSLDKAPDEILASVSIPLPRHRFLFNYEKISRRTHLDIASVNSSCYLELKEGLIADARLSAGGVAAVPFFLKKTSAYLTGQLISPTVMKEAARIAMAEIAPISDARGSIEYKTTLLGQLVKAHLYKLFPEQIPAEEVL